MVKITGLILLFILIFTFYSYSLNKKTIKIIIVNSYNQNHICTSPQVNGFSNLLKKYKNKYNFKIKIFYMNTKNKNITVYNKLKVSSKFIELIDKFEPDFIYTTDDDAMTFVGIPISDKYKVIGSGLNKNPEDYIKQYKLDNETHKITFISEYIRLDGIFNLLEQNNIYIPNFYILSEDNYNASVTNYYMLKNYIKELEGKGKIYIFYIHNISELRKVIINLQERDTGIIIPVIQRVINEEGRYLTKEYISQIIQHINIKHLELAGNSLFCKYGLSICSMPDFYQMGEYAAREIIKSINGENINLNIIYPPNKISVNKERINELHFNRLLDNTNLINNIYDHKYKLD